MPASTSKEVALHLKTVPGWTRRANIIKRTFRSEDFLGIIAFVDRIAKRAQKHDHHPDIHVRSEQVMLALTRHDEDGLTENDFTMARNCDGIFSQNFVA